MDEGTSARVAQQLQHAGTEAAALLGGLNAWAAAFPVERIPEVESAA